MTRFVAGNRITLLCSGTEYFPALQAAMDGAEREIYLETYIFEDDETGRRIAGALARAARRGVTTRLLVDGFGSREMPRPLIAELLEAGVQFLVFRPEVSGFGFSRHRLRRMHRKLAVVDGKTAFVGGINIIDDMHTPNHIPPRFDYAVAIEGPLLADIHLAAARLWQRVAWAHFKQRWSNALFVRRGEAGPCGNQRAAFLVRDNLRQRHAIEKAYLGAIARAREEIVIANAYFLPGAHFRHALASAAARGVRVVLLLQGRVEYLLLHYASRALYGSLLDAGIEIYEYRKSFLHAKVAVMDGRWATVGSSNIDPFSLLLAREANVVVKDRGFAAQLRASLQRAMEEGAVQVVRESWKKQPLPLRFMSWLSYGMVRFLTGVSRYGGRETF